MMRQSKVVLFPTRTHYSRTAGAAREAVVRSTRPKIGGNLSGRSSFCQLAGESSGKIKALGCVW